MNHQRSTPWEIISEGLGKEFKPELRYTPDEKHMDQESFLFILLNVWDVCLFSFKHYKTYACIRLSTWYPTNMYSFYV